MVIVGSEGGTEFESEICDSSRCRPRTCFPDGVDRRDVQVGRMDQADGHQLPALKVLEARSAPARASGRWPRGLRGWGGGFSNGEELAEHGGISFHLERVALLQWPTSATTHNASFWPRMLQGVLDFFPRTDRRPGDRRARRPRGWPRGHRDLAQEGVRPRAARNRRQNSVMPRLLRRSVN